MNLFRAASLMKIKPSAKKAEQFNNYLTSRLVKNLFAIKHMIWQIRKILKVIAVPFLLMMTLPNFKTQQQ